jgi:hypothetical protein
MNFQHEEQEKGKEWEVDISRGFQFCLYSPYEIARAPVHKPTHRKYIRLPVSQSIFPKTLLAWKNRSFPWRSKPDCSDDALIH